MDTETGTMLSLDPKNSRAQLGAARFRSHDVLSPRELDWDKRLSKNIPFEPRTRFPYFTAYAGPRNIYIEVGTRDDRYGGPVRCLRSMAENARMPYEEDDHLVHGRYDTFHWPDLESGFQCLGESLAFLGEEEIPFEQWGQLDISLPDVELPYDMSSPLLLPLDSFSNLRTLTWKGHRKQLIASWLPFTPTLLRTLTTLEIQCDLSLQDCCHMLFYGENLKEFTARIIQRDLSTEHMLGFVPPEASDTTRPLEYLCLVSDEDITPLLHPFNFPSLHRIHFTLAHPAWSTTFHEWRIWPTLERFYLRGPFSTEDRCWVVKQCASAVKGRFAHEPYEAKRASSFIHKGPFGEPFFEGWRPDRD